MIYKTTIKGDTVLEYVKVEGVDGLFYLNKYFNKDRKKQQDYIKDVFTGDKYNKWIFCVVDNIYAYKVLEWLDKYNLTYIVKGYNNDMVILNNIRELYLTPNKGTKIYTPYLGFIKQLKNKFIISEWSLRVYKSGNSYTISWKDFDYCLSLLNDKYKFIYDKLGSRKRPKNKFNISIYKNKALFMDTIKWIQEGFNRMNNGEDVNIPQFEKALTQGTVLDIIELLSSSDFEDAVVNAKKRLGNQYPFNFIKEIENE